MSSCASSTQVNKRLRSTDLAKGRDCISNLPECVLSHILSRLTAKEAVRTCVLSKSWERKWTSIYNINTNDNEVYKEKSSKFLRLKSTKANFSNFVERLLLVSENVKKFRLSCVQEHEASRVISWISTILRRKVENLEVEYYDYGIGITLPPRLLSCTSLRKLKLKLHCTLTVPIKSSLPRLSDLYLYSVEMQNENPQVDTLRFNFPMLETFELRECTWLNVKLVDIYAPKLTTFKYITPSSHDGINNYRIKITAERVAKFESRGYMPENISIVGMVTYADLRNDVYTTKEPQILEQQGAQFRKLLKGISSSEKLMLSGFSAKALEHSKRVPLPVFQKLQRLTLSSGIKAEVFVELLTAAIYLKYLNSDVGNMDGYDYDQVIPHCLLSLETVKLSCITGTTGQLNLAKFLLGNGIVLKKVYLSCASWHHDKDKIVEQLSTFSKCSACLMLIVT